MRLIMTIIASVLFAFAAGAQEQAVNQAMEQVVDDYKVVSDEVKDGV